MAFLLEPQDNLRQNSIIGVVTVGAQRWVNIGGAVITASCLNGESVLKDRMPSEVSWRGFSEAFNPPVVGKWPLAIPGQDISLSKQQIEF